MQLLPSTKLSGNSWYLRKNKELNYILVRLGKDINYTVVGRIRKISFTFMPSCPKRKDIFVIHNVQT